MAWLQKRRLASRLIVAVLLSLLGVASARERADAAATPGAVAAPTVPSVDDTGRLYFSVDTGFHFTLDRGFAGDVEIDPTSGVDWALGGGGGPGPRGGGWGQTPRGTGASSCRCSASPPPCPRRAAGRSARSASSISSR